ncbi:MAG: folate-binding protein [Pseudomonadota bacterium]
MRGFVDDRRVVLSISGADARPLLQDLVTCNLNQLAEDTLVYGALLTPQGKYLFDFFMGLEGDDLMVDIAADRAPAFAQRLMMYRLRRDMNIEATDRPITLIWDTDTAPVSARRDPRDETLGWRAYAPLDGYKAADPRDYDRKRIAAGVPATGVELVENDTYILEAGFERLSGVDFRKGCYVGQEVTARMKHKTALKKGLVRVRVEGDAEPGTAIERDGKPAGTLFTVVDGQGLAHLRFDRADGEMQAGGARVWRAD